MTLNKRVCMHACVRGGGGGGGGVCVCVCAVNVSFTGFGTNHNKCMK